MFLCEIHGVQCGQVFEPSQETLKEQPTVGPVLSAAVEELEEKFLTWQLDEMYAEKIKVG